MNNSKILLAIIVLCFTACTKVEDKEEKNNLLSETLGAVESEGFKKATKIRNFSFPEDHLSHPEYKTEWWYFTGNLLSKENRRFGYQLTIFRNALSPLSTETQSQDSNWQSNQIYMGHFGLTDLEAKQFYSFEILEREALGLSGLEKTPFNLYIDDWSIKSKNRGSYFPLILNASRNGVSLELELNPVKEFTLQGDRGLSQKNKEEGNASYYYSYTRIATKGNITIKGKSYELEGLSWMDREWSTSALSENQEGWDWFSLQLDNNSELMFYQLRNKDGSIDEYSSGIYISPEGEKIRIARDEIELTPLSVWQDKYPIKWSITIPKLDLQLKLDSFLKNQLLNFSIPYWEGCVGIKGLFKGKDIKGSGYLEMTGY